MGLIYRLLENMGYLHPLHPAVTHFPVGLVFGALVLGALSLLFRHENMAKAARYSAVLALILSIPTILFGYMDWQHYYAGGWLYPIKIKIVLAVVLFLLLCAALIFGRGPAASPKSVALYGFCFLVTVALGYFGGQLVYTGKTPVSPPKLEHGARLYQSNCSGCHPYGGNIVDPEAAVRGSDELKDLKTFLHWIRDPRLDNGAKGVMPPFLPSRVTDTEAKEMWTYLSAVMGWQGKAESEGEVPSDLKVKTDPDSIEKGKQIFASYCTRCHAADSNASIIGPGLKGILKRETLPASGRAATPANIYRQLKSPYKAMPSFAQKLKDDELMDVLAYLNTR